MALKHYLAKMTVLNSKHLLTNKIIIMEYKVLPFNANLNQKDASQVAVNQLQSLIDNELANGFEFVSMGSIETSVAPTSGCLGIGAKPGYNTSVAVAVFKKK